jgi:nitroimidazol reductase NimA-like FMN-containing flavoprotein (pyridoxamine 5'-phosphate oxidase superfamily)
MPGAIEHGIAATDHAGLIVIPLDDCLRLMSTVSVGRVAFVSDGEAEVLPVNYTLDGTTVAFRTLQGSKLGAAMHQDAVTFEVDEFDNATSTGWSVVVKGQADFVEDEAVIGRLEAKGLRPYVTSVPRPYWVAIRAHTITGRQVPATH